MPVTDCMLKTPDSERGGAMLTISFPDLTPSEASRSAQELQGRLRRAGVADANMGLLKESSETMDLGSILAIGDPVVIAQAVKLALHYVSGAHAFADAISPYVTEAVLAIELWEISHKARAALCVRGGGGTIEIDARKDTPEDVEARIRDIAGDDEGGPK